MLLRPTGQSTNRGNYYEITLGDSYIDNILQEAQLETSNPATTLGATRTKEITEDEELLNVEQHKQYRRMVGKLQWLSHTRPGMAYATKELARGLQQPTVEHHKKLKHHIRYLKGTKHYKFCISPTVQLRDNNMPLDIVASTHSDWAGRRSTQISNRICDSGPGNTNAFRKQNTGNSGALKRRKRVLRNWNSNNRSIIHQEFPTVDSRQ